MIFSLQSYPSSYLAIQTPSYLTYVVYIDEEGWFYLALLRICMFAHSTQAARQIK